MGTTLLRKLGQFATPSQSGSGDVALYFGTRMLFAGLACLVHGLLPFLFVRTGSRAITELNYRMIVARQVQPLPPLGGDQQLSV